MLCEPEAAALAAFETMPLCGPGMQIKVPGPTFIAKEPWLTLTIYPGDGVLVCDCGGGTVVSQTLKVGTTGAWLT
jgi:hypothetical protein